LGDDELPERDFVGEEEGEIVGWVGRRSHWVAVRCWGGVGVTSWRG
jgi:hypothetical protein